MEMFLGRVCTTDIMNQDMFSNMQKTMERALDCSLQMTLGIATIERLHKANTHGNEGQAGLAL